MTDAAGNWYVGKRVGRMKLAGGIEPRFVPARLELALRMRPSPDAASPFLIDQEPQKC